MDTRICRHTQIYIHGYLHTQKHSSKTHTQIHISLIMYRDVWLDYWIWWHPLSCNPVTKIPNTVEAPFLRVYRSVFYVLKNIHTYTYKCVGHIHAYTCTRLYMDVCVCALNAFHRIILQVRSLNVCARNVTWIIISTTTIEIYFRLVYIMKVTCTIKWGK